MLHRGVARPQLISKLACLFVGRVAVRAILDGKLPGELRQSLKIRTLDLSDRAGAQDLDLHLELDRIFGLHCCRLGLRGHRVRTERPAEFLRLVGDRRLHFVRIMICLGEGLLCTTKNAQSAE